MNSPRIYAERCPVHLIHEYFMCANTSNLRFSEMEGNASGTFWSNYPFAREWYLDALKESKEAKGDHNARRREIVFSVAFTESYLVEWVMIDVLNRDFKRLSDYLPPGDRRGPAERWKEVPRDLCHDKLLSGCLDTRNRFWTEYIRLIEYRNGLIHASSSRPDSNVLPKKEKPIPNHNVLLSLEPGWAFNTAVNLIKELHNAVGTPTPDYLTEHEPG